MYAQALQNEFARDVRTGLTTAGQKTLPCRYLYDDLGSALFEAITLLPEYGLTRADGRVIEAHAGDLLDALRRRISWSPNWAAAPGRRRGPILQHLAAAAERALYYPIDVSPTALARCAQALSPARWQA